MNKCAQYTCLSYAFIFEHESSKAEKKCAPQGQILKVEKSPSSNLCKKSEFLKLVVKVFGFCQKKPIFTRKTEGREN